MAKLTKEGKLKELKKELRKLKRQIEGFENEMSDAECSIYYNEWEIEKIEAQIKKLKK